MEAIKEFFSKEENIKSVVMIVGVVLAFTYLGVAKMSERPAEDYANRDCIRELNKTTKGALTLEQLQEYCAR